METIEPIALTPELFEKLVNSVIGKYSFSLADISCITEVDSELLEDVVKNYEQINAKSHGEVWKRLLLLDNFGDMTADQRLSCYTSLVKKRIGTTALSKFSGVEENLIMTMQNNPESLPYEAKYNFYIACKFLLDIL